jgi:hypothetical protein
MNSLSNIDKIEQQAIKFLDIIQSLNKKTQKEHLKQMTKLIESIAKGEKLDVQMLKNKYLTCEEINLETITETETEEDDTLLDKTIIKGAEYFYENKPDGKVYNNKSQIVGIFKDNKVNLTN